MVYALLLGAQPWLASILGGPLAHALTPPVQIGGLIAAQRGLELFASGKVRHDRWYLAAWAVGVGVASLALVWPAGDPVAQRVLRVVGMSGTMGALLLVGVALLWPLLRQSVGAWAAAAALLPNTVLGAVQGAIALWTGCVGLPSQTLPMDRIEPVLGGVSIGLTAWFNLCMLLLCVARLVQRLRQQALQDPLTNLPNRAHAQAVLAQCQAQVRRHRGMVAVMLLDLDFFKQVNDQHGHALVSPADADAHAAIARADAALYRAKAAGRDRVVTCDDAIGCQAPIGFSADPAPAR